MVLENNKKVSRDTQNSLTFVAQVRDLLPETGRAQRLLEPLLLDDLPPPGHDVPGAGLEVLDGEVGHDGDGQGEDDPGPNAVGQKGVVGAVLWPFGTQPGIKGDVMTK